MAGLSDEEDTDTQAGGTPPAPPPVPAARAVGHGGEIPEERISEIKAAERKRERKRLLLDLYGTDDEEKVKEIQAANKAAIDEAAKLKEEREKARLAELTESERLKQELAAANAKYTTDTEKLTRERDAHKAALELERQDIHITGLASSHIAPKFLKTAKVDFNDYVEKLNKTELAALDEAKINKWFVDYVKKNPEFAPPKPPVVKTAEELAAEKAAKDRAAAPPVRRAPVGAPRTGTGARPPVPAARPVNGPGTYKGKLVKDLSKAEFREYAKTKGMKLPY